MILFAELNVLVEEEMHHSHEEGEGEELVDESVDESGEKFEWELPDFSLSWSDLEELENYLKYFCSGCYDNKPKGYALTKVHGNKDKNGQPKSVDFACDRAGACTMEAKEKIGGKRRRNTTSRRCNCKICFHAFRDDKDGVNGMRWKLENKVSYNCIYKHRNKRKYNILLIHHYYTTDATVSATYSCSILECRLSPEA